MISLGPEHKWDNEIGFLAIDWKDKDVKDVSILAPLFERLSHEDAKGLIATKKMIILSLICSQLNLSFGQNICLSPCCALFPPFVHRLLVDLSHL